jgi:DNA-binding XRE family transcriptional regulator
VSIASINKPTVYNLENELHHAKKPPCWIIAFMICMILAVGGIYSILSFLDTEDAIFYICIFDYYIISGIIICGFIRVFYGFFSIMLVQFESQMIPGPQKEEVRDMQIRIGVIFIMII